MQPELITTVTERGQTSVPSVLRRALSLRTGRKLRWRQVSAAEVRIEVLPDEAVPGPVAMLGFARRFHPSETRTTDEIMAELRDGEAG